MAPELGLIPACLITGMVIIAYNAIEYVKKGIRLNRRKRELNNILSFPYDRSKVRAIK